MNLPETAVRSIVISSLLAVTAGCGRQRRETTGKAPPPAVVAPNPFDRTKLTVERGVFYQRAGSQIVAELHSPLLTAHPGSAVGQLESVEGYFYQNGKRSLHFRAPLASIDDRRRLVILDKGITAESLLAPSRFSAARVEWRWTVPNGLIATGGVQFQRAATTITAGRMEADVALHRARLLEHPVATVGAPS